MVVAEIQARDVLIGCRQAMGLSESPDSPIDDKLLAALLRRSAGFLCPCSRATLRSALLESLQYLGEHEDSLSTRIDGIVEGLIVGGDLLELSEVTIDDSAVKGTWVFAAPPGFIVRPNGSIFLTGIILDQETFLPLSLASRVTHEEFTRVIAPAPEEDLVEELQDLGILELSEKVWLKSPKVELAEDMLTAMKRLLDLQERCGVIQELQILDTTQKVTYYRGRWAMPKNQNGTFVARRPQDYGAPIWCFVCLEDGVPVKLLDLPLINTRWRGCDAAWHLQMAIDHCHGAPQIYRRRRVNDSVRFDFFSPLPQWSQRRLMIFGSPAPKENCLFSYELPISEAETEERFLRENLWMAHIDNSERESR